MKYRYVCPKCGTALELRHRVTQSRRRCPECGTPIRTVEIDAQREIQLKADREYLEAKAAQTALAAREASERSERLQAEREAQRRADWEALRARKRAKTRKTFTWAIISVMSSSMAYVLSRNDENWATSGPVVFFEILALVAMIAFLWSDYNRER